MLYPPEFLHRLSLIVPVEGQAVFLAPGECPEKALRVNLLKTGVEEVRALLDEGNVAYRRVEWCEEALMMPAGSEKSVTITSLLADGRAYWQSLASMLVVKILDPRPGDSVLDMCAAPGSKTTQMAATMKNTGTIMAVEAVRGRLFKLRSVCTLMGADLVKTVFKDARKFRSEELFDRVLVDAPCSTEARFRSEEPESFKYWSPRKIKEMSFKQKGLLLNAGRLLKPGGTMVYSTCTFAPEENEEVVDWFLNKAGGGYTVSRPEIKGIATYGALKSWGKRTYCSETAGCLRLLPSPGMEGFFIAAFKRDR